MILTTFTFSSATETNVCSIETARQHGTTLTEVMQPYGGCLEATGVGAGVPRRTTSCTERPKETVPIDLAGPNEASTGGSIHLIMFVVSASG